MENAGLNNNAASIVAHCLLLVHQEIKIVSFAYFFFFWDCIFVSCWVILGCPAPTHKAACQNMVLNFLLTSHWNFACVTLSYKSFPNYIPKCNCHSTNQAHAVWPIGCLETQVSWLNGCSLACSCLVGTETCKHTVWTAVPFACGSMFSPWRDFKDVFDRDQEASCSRGCGGIILPPTVQWWNNTRLARVLFIHFIDCLVRIAAII